MKSYKSPKVENRKSLIHGIGLFAKEPIKKGEVVTVKSGVIRTHEETMQISVEVGDYYQQISDDLYITPLTKEDLSINALHQNHSCEPNIGLCGEVTFVAMRDIEKDEELCPDTAMTTAHQYHFTCQCGSASCRGTITGDDWRRADLQERYGDHFSSFILRKIKYGDVQP